MNNFKAHRQRLGLSQREVGQALGITGQAYGNYEAGKREADYATLRKLADLYATTIDDLLRPPEAAEEAAARDSYADLLEQYRTRPGMRVLFSAAKGATEKELTAVAGLFDAMKNGPEGEGGEGP